METNPLPPPVTASPAAAPVSQSVTKPRSAGRTVLIVLGVLLLCCGITAAATAWWVKRNVYASPMTPVSLTATEEVELQQKIAAFENPAAAPAVSPEEAKRTLVVSQKEVNAYLAKQGLGESVKVDLNKDALAVSTLIPVPPDAPFLGGTTLRIRVSLAASMNDSHQVVLNVQDVSLGGVPMPNAWLGDIKGVNLVTSDINTNPALKRFFDGIKEMDLEDDSLRVVLNE